MDRLTTDTPSSMTETLHNLAYAQDRWVHIRGMETSFLQYIENQCRRHGCDLSEMSEHELCETICGEQEEQSESSNVKYTACLG